MLPFIYDHTAVRPSYTRTDSELDEQVQCQIQQRWDFRSGLALGKFQLIKTDLDTDWTNLDSPELSQTERTKFYG
jgi:hypothetical protein